MVPNPLHNAGGNPSSALGQNQETFRVQAGPPQEPGLDPAIHLSAANGHHASVQPNARCPDIEMEQRAESIWTGFAEFMAYNEDMSLVDEETVGARTVSMGSPEAIELRRLPIAEDIHHICLDATRVYLTQFKRNVEFRRPPVSPQYEDGGSGSSSGSSTQTGASVVDDSSERLYREADVTNSLKNNVSTICSIIWAESQALKMLRPASEVEAVTEMRALVDASEKVLEGLEWLEDGSGDAAREMIDAGVVFCRCLENQAGEDAVDDIGQMYLGWEW